MKFNKLSAVLGVVVVIAALVVSSLIRDMQESREKARLLNLLNPVLVKAVEGTPDPKPSISFVSPTKNSLVVVLSWTQNPEAAIKNDMRERVASAFRAELAADPASWGRYLSVIFDNEVVTQGFK